MADEANPILPTIMYEVAANFPEQRATTIALIELNCRQRSSRSLQFTAFRRDGSVQSQANAAGQSSYAAPDSNADGWLKMLCRPSAS